MLFLKEREERLGAKIIYRTFSTWYARIGHEKREYGVFLYTDGHTVVFEDFDREPAILGIPIRRGKPRGEVYKKLEVSFPISDIRDISQVTWSSAVKAARCGRDISKSANWFDRIFRRILTKLSLNDGTIIYIEPFNHTELVSKIKEFREES